MQKQEMYLQPKKEKYPDPRLNNELKTTKALLHRVELRITRQIKLDANTFRFWAILLFRGHALHIRYWPLCLHQINGSVRCDN